MRKLMVMVYLLGTIVLFASASSKHEQVKRSGPEPPCFPCSGSAQNVR